MSSLTHHPECWREHHECAVALVERLQAEPRVHPLALEVLHTMAIDDMARGWTPTGVAVDAAKARVAWRDDGCPIYSPPIDPTDQTTHPGGERREAMSEPQPGRCPFCRSGNTALEPNRWFVLCLSCLAHGMSASDPTLAIRIWNSVGEGPNAREAYEAGYGHGYRNGAFDIGGDIVFDREDYDPEPRDSFDIWLSERKDP